MQPRTILGLVVAAVLGAAGYAAARELAYQREVDRQSGRRR